MKTAIFCLAFLLLDFAFAGNSYLKSCQFQLAQAMADIELQFDVYRDVDLEEIKKLDLSQINEIANQVDIKLPMLEILFAPGSSLGRNRINRIENEMRLASPRAYQIFMTLGYVAKAKSKKLKKDEEKITGARDIDSYFLQDAARHSFWSAMLAKYLGKEIALCLTTLHEIDNHDFPMGRYRKADNVRKMDFINNALAAKMGEQLKSITKNQLVEAIILSIKNGSFYVLDPMYRGSQMQSASILSSEVFYQ